MAAPWVLGLAGFVAGTLIPSDAAPQTTADAAAQSPAHAAVQTPADMAAQTPAQTAPSPASSSGLAAPPPAGTPDQANSATYPTPSEPETGASPAQAADPNAAANQHRRNALRTAAASGNTGSINTGMAVQTKTGESEGSVVAVVHQTNGRPTYIVIADHGGQRRAVTYQAARLMVHGNHLVVDAMRLQGAPLVPSETHEGGTGTGRPAWQAEADRYWGS